MRGGSSETLLPSVTAGEHRRSRALVDGPREAVAWGKFAWAPPSPSAGPGPERPGPSVDSVPGDQFARGRGQRMPRGENSLLDWPRH